MIGVSGWKIGNANAVFFCLSQMHMNNNLLEKEQLFYLQRAHNFKYIFHPRDCVWCCVSSMLRLHSGLWRHPVVSQNTSDDSSHWTHHICFLGLHSRLKWKLINTECSSESEEPHLLVPVQLPISSPWQMPTSSITTSTATYNNIMQRKKKRKEKSFHNLPFVLGGFDGL